ncbi:MAG TPA: hypothetical protein VJT32_13240 [bacterium]|nr:hypothetical protein [bacterium]
MMAFVVGVVVVLAVAVVVGADFIRACLWSWRMRVAERQTARAGRARWNGGRGFLIPVDAQRSTVPRLFVEPNGGGSGCPRFTHDAGRVKAVHHDETGVLLQVYGRGSALEHMAFVYVVDASTDRPALLRVPPGMTRAREAVAWTFGMEEREWDPVLEA